MSARMGPQVTLSVQIHANEMLVGGAFYDFFPVPTSTFFSATVLGPDLWLGSSNPRSFRSRKNYSAFTSL